LPNSLGLRWSISRKASIPFRIEGAIDGVRAVRTPSERLRKALLVELMDGVAHCLRVTAEVAGDLIGVLPTGAGEQDLATA
jgi:hypothetical protein